MVLKKNSPGDVPKEKHFQCICDLWDEGFNQKSRINRDTEPIPPPFAPSAADLEKPLSGIKYPLRKEKVLNYETERK